MILTSGRSATCTVVLSGGNGGIVVSLAAGSVLSVQPEVSIPVGYTSASFQVSAGVVSAPRYARVIAVLGGRSESVSLLVNPGSP
jgi:hypothetical protein